MDQVKQVSDGHFEFLAKSNPTAEACLLMFAMRKRLSHALNLRRFKFELISEGFKVVNEDYNNFWKDLQNVEVGKILSPRNPEDSDLFVFNVSLKKIGAEAFGFSSTTKESKVKEIIKIKRNELKQDKKQLEAKTPKRGRGRPKGSKNKVKKSNVHKINSRKSSNKSLLTKDETQLLQQLLNKIAKIA